MLRFTQDIKVSIIVPCYNYAHFMEEALESILAQSYTNWECVIINDGSTDNTEQIALRYCSQDVRFKYYDKENGGHSSARNLGIKNSSGQYILPLDPDDKIAEYYLEKAVTVLENNPSIKIACFQTQLFGDVDQIIKMPPYDLRSLLIVNYMVNTCMFRRSDFDQTKGYDETMLGFEDWNLWIDLLKKGGTVEELPLIGYHYRKKELSVFNTFLKDRKRVYRDLLKLYMNHINVYEKYFDSPVQLIQENEKMKKVIKAYQQTRTYKWGLKIHSIKNFLLKKHE